MKNQPIRYLLLFIALFLSFHIYAQQNCLKNSKLYYFDPNSSPRIFTEKLGNHPEFPFLQQMNGVNSVATFIQAINNPENQKKYTREFNAFDLLLRNSGFTNGYKDINETNVEDMFVKRGTIGNLGFYDRQKDMISYIYVKLTPAGESKSGIAAWKLTTEKGCYLYILHTCGNAFYPNNSPKAGASGKGVGIGMAGISGSCKIADIQTEVKPLEIRNDSFDRKVHITINLVEGQLVPGKHRKDPNDTVYQLLRKFDTLTSFKDKEGKQLKIFANPQENKLVICRDTTLKLYTQLMVDSSQPNSHDPIRLVYADTVYRELPKEKPLCKNKLEIDIDGGMSFSSVVRYNNATEHSQTDGAHLAGEFAISQIFTPWFQAGISASYITLSFQDDFPYPGATPGTYSRVILGNPIIPVQLFGKFTLGKQVGWQSTVTLSVGYSFPMNAKIENNGTTLTTDPAVKSAPTAGVKLGLNYFFTCKFGMGIAVAGQYFSNQGALMKYSLFSLPITGGFRFRF